ncbi:unnamed protein product, partial [Rotaria sordida]
MYDNMGEYSKALEFQEKSLEIKKQNLPPDHIDLASSYHGIGGIYSGRGEYAKALEFYERSHEICKVALSPNHPNLATSYNNI